MGDYPNITKEEALEAINKVILYIRQLGYRKTKNIENMRKAEEVEKYIMERSNKG